MSLKSAAGGVSPVHLKVQGLSNNFSAFRQSCLRDYAHLPVKQAKYVRTLLRTGNPPAVLPKPVSEVQLDINASMAALGPPLQNTEEDGPGYRAVSDETLN